MKQIINLFLPNLKSMRSVFYEVANTSISRERFIDFIKLIGILFLMINSFTLLRLQNSGGELFVSNLSVNSQSLMVVTWFTAGMSLFFFSMGFNNLIAWYSNVGRDGSQWNYLVDRINTLLGPVIVWIFSSTIVLNILSRSENFPNYLTTSEDGIMSSIEFILWPLWESKLEKINLRRKLLEDIKAELLEETLDSLRKIADTLEDDQWKYQDFSASGIQIKLPF